jgi:two-component system OmpR family response regulator
MNVLIVEDSPHVAEHIASLLADAGATIVATHSTEDGALAACDRFHVELAIVDLQLHQGTGFGVMRHLRARHSGPGCAIAVITNHAVPALKVASFEAGTDYFVDKKHGFEQLVRIYQELQRKEVHHG